MAAHHTWSFPRGYVSRGRYVSSMADVELTPAEPTPAEPTREPTHLDAELDAVLVGGRERRPVVLTPYDPSWPARYESERDRVARALGRLARSIEHIGSTAVPGLAAKPVVDVLVTVSAIEDTDAYSAPLLRAGYELRVREAGHRMFRTRARDVHVHVWPAGSEERRYLLLRERLRGSAEDRLRYEEVKRELAAREWPDVNYYAEAKSAVIADILARAPAELSGAPCPRPGT